MARACQILKPDSVAPGTLKLRKTPRGDAILTGVVAGAEAESTVAIYFSSDIADDRAQSICRAFSGEFFENVVAQFSAEMTPIEEAISNEEFDAMFSVTSEEGANEKHTVTVSAGVETNGPLYEVTIARAGETLAFDGGKPLVFQEGALKDAVPIFNGVKVRVYRNGGFFDHLKNLSIRLASMFPDGMKDAEVGELNNARWDAEAKRIVADLALNDSTQAGALDKMLRKVNTSLGSLSKFLGLSMVVDVLGAGTEILSIVGCSGVDVVSVPAAGGHFERILNSVPLDEENPMKETIIKLLLALDPNLKGLDEKSESDLFTLYNELNNKRISDLTTQVQTLSANQNGTELKKEIEGLKDSMAQTVAAHQRQFLLMSATERVKASALPESSKTRLFSALNNVKELTDDAVTALINDEANYVDSLKKDVGFSGLGVQGGYEAPDKIQKALEYTFGVNGATHEFGSINLQQFYKETTGDFGMTNKVNPRRISFATATTSSFTDMLANVLNKRLLQAYMEAPWNEDKLITETKNVSDFRDQRIGNVGGFGNFSTVAENGTYQEVSIPDDFKMDYSVAKYGGLFPITWECIVNDDVGLVRRLVDKFGIALRRTHAAYVYNLLLQNSGLGVTMWDSALTFASDNSHGNYATTAYSTAGLTALITAFYNQTEPGSSAKLGLKPMWLFIPQALYETAWKLNQQEFLDAAMTANPHRYLWGQNAERIVIVPFFTDTTDYYVMGNPAQCPVIEMGYFQGQRRPELLTQDNPTVGSVFTNDKYTYKVRHIYGGTIADWRNLAARIVAG